jgi:HNH endonuclease
LARNLLRPLDDDTRAWVRRIFTDPCTGLVSAIDPKRRRVTGALREAIIVRDQWCRVPWCGAPIRHVDHVTSVEYGGETTEANTQGLCEACNYAKQAPGWRTTPSPRGAGVSVEITTPTGHTYESRPPPLPGFPQPDEQPVSTQRTEPAIEIYLPNPFDVEYAA